jgi:hypothetical protein
MAYRPQARNKRTGEIVAQSHTPNNGLGRPQTQSEALLAAETIANRQNIKDSRDITNTDWVAEAIEWFPEDSNNRLNSGRPGYNAGSQGFKAPRATFTWKE